MKIFFFLLFLFICCFFQSLKLVTNPASVRDYDENCKYSPEVYVICREACMWIKYLHSEGTWDWVTCTFLYHMDSKSCTRITIGRDVYLDFMPCDQKPWMCWFCVKNATGIHKLIWKTNWSKWNGEVVWDVLLSVQYFKRLPS